MRAGVGTNETIGHRPTAMPGGNDVASYRRAGGVPDSDNLRSVFECLREHVVTRAGAFSSF